MSINRVRIARDKGEFVQSLVNFNQGIGPFQTYADVIAFAAALGVKYQERVAIENVAKEPSPINLEIFISRGYDTLIKLLAVNEFQDTKILSLHGVDSEALRLTIFEEYANAGLARLERELRGAVDYTERLLLIISQERFREITASTEFDLGRFL
ncbi:DNA phosphorothioation-associated protein 4 [Microcystis aeruginosa]|jgi:dnd system-associated protein 4|uniref:DNA phosphorothioation-associated protein 4 n=1 Tax=Microcystis aeruginosa Ma_QC_C_20070703_M131 TaxID=2486263 RepID=A0A551Y7F6_MICAE|nr:DNA phosphorothioation-associated protein 4 [Microcystis aeruginosa]MDB9392617.1 DNA phosphorothioation-associated protein 4 [Microcystis aeruginosa CS-579]TRT56906.1 MAG: DNA phosphorothioation-associated protein 4 [Microcystis aeruginosa Ma_QC_C_20070703_M131]